MARLGVVLAAAGVLLLGGCADQSTEPSPALSAGAAGPQALMRAAPSALTATATPETMPRDPDLTAPGADDPVETPRSAKLVAAPGGSIIVESSAEQAVRKQQRAAMMKEVDPPRIDFNATGTTPNRPKP